MPEFRHSNFSGGFTVSKAVRQQLLDLADISNYNGTKTAKTMQNTAINNKKWTPECPRETGYYWRHDPTLDSTVTNPLIERFDAVRDGEVKGEFHRFNNENVQWSGPVASPLFVTASEQTLQSSMDDSERYWPSDIAHDIDDEGPFDFIERAAEQLESVSEGFLSAHLSPPSQNGAAKYRQFLIQSQCSDESLVLFTISFPPENFPLVIDSRLFKDINIRDYLSLQAEVKEILQLASTRDIVRAMIQRAKA